ncbi:MAG: hypothetical protein IJ958_04265, partial [Agathobacter sp.]|nr:hypothetical protein [Agathobacter sp.]
MIKKGATSKEIDFILHIALYQDMSGTVESVYYKDICNAISVSHTKFYDILNSLSEKELISYKKLNRADVCVQLLENDFRGNSFKKGSKGYLKVGTIDFVKKDGNTKWVLKEMPILMEGSGAASKVALAAKKQGKY